jgi:hypothetical protein
MANGLFNLKQVVQAVQQGGWPAQKTPAVEYLVVAGGGGGGAYYGGGGGAGGLLQGLDPVPNGQTILVTVGGGGNGASGAGTGVNGSASVFGQISTAGGGGGAGGSASSVKNGLSGGSGGGGQNYDAGGAFAIGGSGVSGQGNAGSGGVGGGGGGAGTVGYRAGNVTKSGGGGAGIVTTIGGTATAYAGGGSGAGGSIPGGVGGGGAANVAGTANTGGGGGGDSGSNGGSGIVIVSYPDVYAAATATTGSPTVSTSGSGSIYFNGSSYFSYNAQTPFAFGTGDFTIEFWLYATAFGGGPILYDCRPTSGNGAYPTIYAQGTGALKYFTNSVDAISGATLSTSTWYHIAVCRTGTVTKLYVNGTQSGSAYTDTTNYIVGSGRPTVGGSGSSPGSSGDFYMTNVRVVKGVCVYTGNFTTPTAPLQATQPAGTNIAAITSTSTSLLLNANSGAFLADNSTNSYAQSTTAGTPAWNQLSPFTVTGYKNRVYKWTSSGSITF